MVSRGKIDHRWTTEEKEVKVQKTKNSITTDWISKGTTNPDLVSHVPL